MSQAAPVTVVIPAYNAAAYLGTTLEALRGQTTPPERVIVVDDGSIDGTIGVAHSMGVEVVSQEQRGPGAARNRALQMADTEFVAFCDADDWFVSDKLERDVQKLGELGAACLSSDAWIVRGDRIEGRKNEQRVVPNVLTEEFLLQGNPIICSTVTARREAVMAVGGFDESRELIATEDYDLWLRMASREPIAYSNHPMSFYRVHSASLSGNERFMNGVDRILVSVAERHPGEPHYANLIRRRRAAVRLDYAWELLAEGRRADARAMVCEAQQTSWTWKGFKMRLRTLFGR